MPTTFDAHDRSKLSATDAGRQLTSIETRQEQSPCITQGPIIPSEIMAFADELRAIRRDIHMHPELAFEESRTSDIVARELKKYGCEVHRGIAKTGVIGVLRCGASGRSIGLRADMDALPIAERNHFSHASRHQGRMHACGHDGHTTMLLGAARYLASTRNFDGTVNFIFQPAEESGGGARVMVEEGLFERFPCDSVFALHNRPGIPVGQMGVKPGPLCASEDNFEIKVLARGSHAAHPHLGIDPFVVGAQIVMALHTIRSRNVDPIESGLVSIGYMRGGTVQNVIPDDLTMGGTVRTYAPRIQEILETRIREIATGTAAAFGAKVDIRYTHDYPPTINDEASAAFASSVAAEICGEGGVNRRVNPSMGAEDFSFMLGARPGAMLLLGNGAGEGSCILHNPLYDFNDEATPVGVAFFARLAERKLSRT